MTGEVERIWLETVVASF